MTFLNRQNALIAACGSALLILWTFVTAVSKGLPLSWCEAIDQFTFQTATPLVYKMANGFFYDTANNDMPTVAFFVLFFIACLLVYTLMRVMEKSNPAPGAFILILLFAALFRMALIPGEPIHENDFYRYLWDGASAKHGINPYKYAPSDVFMYEHGYTKDYYDAYNDVTLKGKLFTPKDADRLNELIRLRDKAPYHYARIGHWQVPTIYPPLAQWVFWLISVVKENSYYVMKFIFILFDLGVIVVTALLLKHFSLNPGMVVVYAWSPLVLKEFANSGHYDPVAIFFNMLAILLFFKGKKALSVIGLAFGALAKFFSGFLIPIFLKKIHYGWLALFFWVCALSYVPYFFWDDAGILGVFEGLGTYNEEWSYNASIFAVIYYGLAAVHEPFAGTLLPAKTVVGALYLGLLFWLFWAKTKTDVELLHRFFLAVAGLFILNPVGDPWYYCWAIPFLCFFPYRSWLLLSVLLILSYFNFQSDYAFLDKSVLNIPLLSWVIYVPFFAVLGYEAIRKPRFTEQFETSTP